MRSRLHHLSWRWRARRFRRAPRLPAILLYHSVAERESDPLHLTVPPARFAAHLDWLAAQTAPLALAEFVRRQGEGTLPANAVAVTFDDGYADNVSVAEPLLRARGIPATVFVATDYIDARGEGWWDELDAIFLSTPRLPARFETAQFACEVEPALDPAQASWTILAPPRSRREAAFLAASAFARQLGREERRNFMATLRAWSQRAPDARRGCGFASWDELRSALGRGVLSIGAHTRSHPVLADISVAEQREEIEGSCRDVRANLGVEPAGFAYPFGTYHDFSPVTRTLAAATTVRFACANMPARVHRGTDPWQLPRVLIWDWSVSEFARRLGA